MNAMVKMYFIYALLFVVSIGSVEAAMVVHEEIGVVSKTQHKQTNFIVKSEGWYSASIKDMEFTDSLQDYRLGVRGDGENPKDHQDQAGTEFEFYALPGLYFIDVFATAGNTLGLGMYGVQVELLPPSVPLPPSVYLLISAILSLVYVSKKRRHCIKTNDEVFVS